jgi:hypothetical protein
MGLTLKRKTDEQVTDLINRSNNCMHNGFDEAAIMNLLQIHSELMLRIIDEQRNINQRLDKIVELVTPKQETDERFESLDYLDS